MTPTVRHVNHMILGLGIGAAALLWNGVIPPGENSQLISSADARIGRPATPASYAGVARRTTRRTVAVGTAAYPAARATVGYAATRTAVTGAAVAGAAVAANCTRVVGPAGRAVTVCR